MKVSGDPEVNIADVGIRSVGWEPREQVIGPLYTILLPYVNGSAVVRACGS